ncbi:MAG: Zn-dependent exopeptidase M28 [bacterium]|nr:Zn-dependent exopeptidase M28 [bacterium]
MNNFIKQLSCFKHRLSGSPENSEAVGVIEEIFRSFGWVTIREGFRVHGHFAWGIIINLFPLLVIYILLREHYLLSLGLYAVVAVSFWGELSLSFHLLRWLIPAHGACNMEARFEGEDESKPLVIVLAHHDSPKTGLIYHEKLARPVARLLVRLPGIFRRIFLLPFVGVLMLGAGMVLRPVSWAQWVSPVFSYAAVFILALTLFFLIEWAFSAPSPGANDNGSGVLVLMELARRFSTVKPSGVSVRLLATGAEETGYFGIKAYMKRHKEELKKRDPLFINLESIGGGELYWVTEEEFLGKFKYPAKGFAHLESSLRRASLIALTDGAPLAKAGFGVLTLIGLEDGAIPVNYHRVTDTFDRLDVENLSKAADIVEAIITARPGPFPM